MGVDQDYRTILAQASRCALADGWGGSMIATELQDILFGTPIPRQARANLGVLREDTVNIIIHGHEPTLSEMIVLAAQDPKLIAKAKAAGAKGGITVAGMCCTANETLMRHGVPIAGNSMQQELALATGAVEAMVVDVQCIMQSVVRVAQLLPQQDHHHLVEGAHQRRAAHAVRRAPRARRSPRRSSSSPLTTSRTAAKSKYPPRSATSWSASATRPSATCSAAGSAPRIGRSTTTS